eukprot:2041359-Karenia_brevis.AAC.1
MIRATITVCEKEKEVLQVDITACFKCFKWTSAGVERQRFLRFHSRKTTHPTTMTHHDLRGNSKTL